MMLTKAVTVLLGTAMISLLNGAAGGESAGAAIVPLDKNGYYVSQGDEALSDDKDAFYLSLLRGSKGDNHRVNDISGLATDNKQKVSDIENTSKRVRRVGKLGKSTSQEAPKVDCGTSLDIQFYDASSVLTFHPSASSCHTGKRFSGATKDGKIVVTLVPGYNNDGSFHAVVTNEETGVVYSIGPNAEGEMMVSERHQKGFGSELWPLDANTLNEDKIDPLKTSVNDQIKNASDASTLGTELSTIDVLVLWTRDAECRNANETRGCTTSSNTTAVMRGMINTAIEITNEAYMESGVFAEINLVYAYLDHSYQETVGDPFMPALEHVTKKGDGHMDEVHELRELYGADAVAMIIDDEIDGYCGKAWIGPRKNAMFSVTRWDCAAAAYSFAHELSHTMGANHDRAQGNKCTDTSQFAYAYRDPDGKFRSIMAYECKAGECDHTYGSNVDCTRVKRFSNTDHLYNSNPIGDVKDNNAHQINEVREEVAGYFNRTRVQAMSDLGKCVEASNETDEVYMSDCRLDNANQVFHFNTTTHQVTLKSTGKCLDYLMVNVLVRDCTPGMTTQQWHYNKTTQSLKTSYNDDCLYWFNDGLKFSGCHGGNDQKFMLPSAWLPYIYNEEVDGVFISEKR